MLPIKLAFFACNDHRGLSNDKIDDINVLKMLLLRN